MSSSFERIITELASKLPRKEDKELLEKLAKTYQKDGAEAVKDALENMIESIESE